MNTMPCWNCDGEMRRFGEDSFYYYYRCPKCGKTHTELRDDRPGKIGENNENNNYLS